MFGKLIQHHMAHFCPSFFNLPSRALENSWLQFCSHCLLKHREHCNIGKVFQCNHLNGKKILENYNYKVYFVISEPSSEKSNILRKMLNIITKYWVLPSSNQVKKIWKTFQLFLLKTLTIRPNQLIIKLYLWLWWDSPYKGSAWVLGFHRGSFTRPLPVSKG